MNENLTTLAIVLNQPTFKLQFANEKSAATKTKSDIMNFISMIYLKKKNS